MTRRELYNGIFADQEISYGNELPSFILVVLIGVGELDGQTLIRCA